MIMMIVVFSYILTEHLLYSRVLRMVTIMNVMVTVASVINRQRMYCLLAFLE